MSAFKTIIIYCDNQSKIALAKNIESGGYS